MPAVVPFIPALIGAGATMGATAIASKASKVPTSNTPAYDAEAESQKQQDEAQKQLAIRRKEMTQTVLSTGMTQADATTGKKTLLGV